MSTQNPESSTTTKVILIVAVIGLIGTLGAAVIGNFDKLFGKAPAATSPGSSPYPKNMGPLELRTNRQGSDFSPNPEPVQSPEACARLCADSLSCKAMTYVSSPNNLPGGGCWLKTSVPPKSTKNDMTSAVKLDG